MKTAALYIHIPFCIQKCRYCDFFSQTRFSSFVPYQKNTAFIERILYDAALFKRRYGIDSWETVYVGGGTPSLLSPEDVFYLAESLCSTQSEAITEFTIEANPEDITAEWLAACAAGGINRLSAGVQSLSDAVLKKAGRRGSIQKSLAALETIKKNWGGTLSCDLIAGLNGQTAAGLCSDLERITAYQPEHISLYGLCSSRPLPEEQDDAVYELLAMGFALLEKHNYRQYEVSNFSLGGAHKSLHNCMYWNMRSYAGVGPAAAGTLVHEDTNGKALYAERFECAADIAQWEAAAEPFSAYTCEEIPHNVLLEEVIIMGFRLTEGINRAVFMRRFGKDLLFFIGKTAEKAAEKGWCVITPQQIRLTAQGLFFLNAFLVDVLAELEQINTE